MSNTERNKALNAASGAASKRLREAHSEEWNKYMIEEATARNQKWEPKPTPEEKAEAEFKALLEQFPHLADEIKTEPVTMPEPPPKDPA